MPTAKRERQRALRQARQAQLERARRRRKLRRRGIAAAVVVVVGVGLVYVFNGGFSGAKKPAPAKARTTACPAANGRSPRRTVFSAPPATCINPSTSYSALVTTDAGAFTIALDARSAPRTVNDFVFLARYHFYDGLSFHRVIPGFVVQGGNPNPANPAKAQGPGYTIRGEVPAKGAYQIGSVAMAKTSSDPNGSASSQFFVVTGPEGVALPPDYSLFGRVTSGLAVVDKIQADGTAAGTPKVTHHMVSVKISP